MDVHPTKNVSIGIDPYPHQKKAGFDKGNFGQGTFDDARLPCVSLQVPYVTLGTGLHDGCLTILPNPKHCENEGSRFKLLF